MSSNESDKEHASGLAPRAEMDELLCRFDLPARRRRAARRERGRAEVRTGVEPEVEMGCAGPAPRGVSLAERLGDSFERSLCGGISLDLSPSASRRRSRSCGLRMSIDADTLGAALTRVLDVLRRHQVSDFAFTGGIAVGVWSAPRQTNDLDVCGALPTAEVDRLLALRDVVRSGAGQIPDLVRFRVGTWDVDLFVAKSAYDRECLARAVPTQLEGIELRIVTAEDLLIHKMIKLRTDRRRMLQDLADVRAVVDAQRAVLDWEYVERWLDPPTAALLRSVSEVADEELVRRWLSM
jgi:hypothetical protein